MRRKNHNTFLKKQRAERKRKAKQEKRLKKENRKNQTTSGKLKDMMAYLDEDGNIIPVEQESDNSDQAETGKE